MEKSPKALRKMQSFLHFLAFGFFDLLFGVLRGEQPLRRGSLHRNSETFFATFFGHKKGRLAGGCRDNQEGPQGGPSWPPQSPVLI